MPKPSPIWIAEDSLDSYACVLLNDYVPWARGDASPFFHALIGGDMFAVDKSKVHEFLIRHQDRVFITYDAAVFHKACLTASVLDDEKQAVWDLSRRFRLWDLALLKMRINYASKGFVKNGEQV